MAPLIPTRLRWRMWRAIAWAHYRYNALRGYRPSIRKFEKKLGYTPNLEAPKTNNERMLLRKLKDHDPRFRIVSDKATVRDFIDDVMGQGTSERLCLPVLAHVENFADLPDSIWSQDVILKCTHGSGKNCIVRAGDVAARRIARKRMNRWLGRNHAVRNFEWGYIDLVPSIIAEPLVTLDTMTDLKVFCCDGIVRFVMPEDVPYDGIKITMNTPDWTPADFEVDGLVYHHFDRPEGYDEILEIATALSRGFDNIRIDFIMSKDRFYLGEITVYGGSGYASWRTIKGDIEFAKYWKQPHLGVDV